MKTVKVILILATALVIAINVNAQKKGEKTVVFKANLHCESCKAKVEKNIPYEKGVKNLKVDMGTQTISVTFREDKNNTDNLQKAIEKLKIEVKGIEGNSGCTKKAKDAACCQGEKKDCCKQEKK